MFFCTVSDHLSGQKKKNISISLRRFFVVVGGVYTYSAVFDWSTFNNSISGNRQLSVLSKSSDVYQYGFSKKKKKKSERTEALIGVLVSLWQCFVLRGNWIVKICKKRNGNDRLEERVSLSVF